MPQAAASHILSHDESCKSEKMKNNTSIVTTNFIHEIIDNDICDKVNNGTVHTRFPPEPNGFAHIGHAKSLLLNFGIARKYHGKCNLRFDDSNPTQEKQEYVDAFVEDIRWLGCDWGKKIYYASDYYEKFYCYAVQLIEQGNAYVDELSSEQIREYRGTLTAPGRNSPQRDRPIAENLELFQRMRDGEFADGEYLLRAKIDMASPNLNMRDPVIYRIRHSSHYRTGNDWCIYPMYDFVHCLSDAIEGITHSLCTLEFEDHRPLYDWYLQQLISAQRPRQYEFARLNLSHTVTSKRKLQTLVEQNHVGGWDDPRLPTLSGLRRRGCPAEAIHDFCQRIGVTKNDTLIDMEVLENSIREAMDACSPRMLAVLQPLKVIIENYPDGEEVLPAPLHPSDPSFGERELVFGRELYIERDDFMEDPPKKFFRLAPGREVRLRYAYFITCTRVIKDAQGNITELHCTYDPDTRGGNAPDGRKVKGTLHWVAAKTAICAEVRLYERLFATAAVDNDHWLEQLNPHSMQRLLHTRLEPMLANATAGECFQFERIGYFYVDTVDSVAGKPVFNCTVPLRSSLRSNKG